MGDQQVLDVLSDLLAAVETSPHEYVFEATPFLSPLGAEEALQVRDMDRQEHNFAADLANVLLELGGTPRLRPPDRETADLYYLDFRFLLREVLASKRKLLAQCEAALDALREEPAARDVVSRLAAAEREHVATVERFAAGSDRPVA